MAEMAGDIFEDMYLTVDVDMEFFLILKLRRIRVLEVRKIGYGGADR
jgi:hypothetical protein